MIEILEFLKELDQNNNREWFDANRSRYEKTRARFLDFTANLIFKIREFDDEIPLLNPKDCMFRIFRDVRFSNDKRPFKTNYGSYIARGGRKLGFAGYYFHIQPGEIFLSGGVYMPPPEHLQAIRQEIYYHPEDYIALIENQEFKSTYTQAYFDKLKIAPKGFPKDWEHIELLKNRSYAYGKPLTEQELASESLLEDTIRSFKTIFPVNRFLNKSIDENLVS
jgi:uncharacterized protein (TIGR02453 family)